MYCGMRRMRWPDLRHAGRAEGEWTCAVHYDKWVYCFVEGSCHTCGRSAQ